MEQIEFASAFLMLEYGDRDLIAEHNEIRPCLLYADVDLNVVIVNWGVNVSNMSKLAEMTKLTWMVKPTEMIMPTGIVNNTCLVKVVRSMVCFPSFNNVYRHEPRDVCRQVLLEIMGSSWTRTIGTDGAEGNRGIVAEQL